MNLHRVVPTWTLFLQGWPLVATGIYALMRPAEVVKMFPVDGTPDPLLVASSLSLVGLGVYQVLAGQTPALHRLALFANVPLRLLAAGVFAQHPQAKGMAVNELVFAGINAAALIFTISY